MADPKKSQDYNFAGGLGNINPAEVPDDALKKYRNTLDENVKALQQRYDQPNYFKIAAGFAKPQLGGFIASLGSAADAMGDTVEQQREQQLPIAQMKVQMQQANIMLGQKQKQNEIYQDWLAKNTKPDGSITPMDATTYSRLASLGDTPILQAASKYYEGAEKGLGLKVAATSAMGKDPMLQAEEFAKFQLNPNADPKQAQAKQEEFAKSLAAARPPQTDPAQWNAMSRYDQMEASANYAREQRERGMSVEDVMRQQANTAPERLGLLRSIRELALGAGIENAKTPDNKEFTGQQQMGELLNKFGGNNPIEVFGRAAADGKLGDTLRDIDVYARQLGMSEQAKNKFQVLVKLLAENQVALRGSVLNPTDAFGELQRTSVPNIGNSQSSLVTLVDLMGHAEKNAQEKYNYAMEKKLPYGRLERDTGYNELRGNYAKEHTNIATSNPLDKTPSWFNPSAGNVSAKPEAKPEAKPQGGQSRPNDRTINGQVWSRQPDGSWKPKQ